MGNSIRECERAITKEKIEKYIHAYHTPSTKGENRKYLTVSPCLSLSLCSLCFKNVYVRFFMYMCVWDGYRQKLAIELGPSIYDDLNEIVVHIQSSNTLLCFTPLRSAPLHSIRLK